jgi:hypothetical protein
MSGQVEVFVKLLWRDACVQFTIVILSKSIVISFRVRRMSFRAQREILIVHTLGFLAALEMTVAVLGMAEKRFCACLYTGYCIFKRPMEICGCPWIFYYTPPICNAYERTIQKIFYFKPCILRRYHSRPHATSARLTLLASQNPAVPCGRRRFQPNGSSPSI